MRTLLWLLLIAFSPAADAATVPPKITYPGTLRTDSLPANGQKTLSFDLYDSDTGNLMWASGNQTYTISNGLVKVVLGETSNPISSSTVNGSFTANGKAMLMQTTVDGTALAPREVLASAPFALKAGAVAGLRLTPDSAMLGIGLARDPTAKLQFRGAIHFSPIPPAAIADPPIEKSRIYLEELGGAPCAFGNHLELKAAVTGTNGVPVTATLATSECY